MSKAAAIGIDIAGTQIKAVAVDGEGTVLGRCHTDTCDQAEILLERVDSLLEQLPSSDALGISTTGLVLPGSNKVAWIKGRVECLHGLDWSHRPISRDRACPTGPRSRRDWCGTECNAWRRSMNHPPPAPSTVFSPGPARSMFQSRRAGLNITLHLTVYESHARLPR